MTRGGVLTMSRLSVLPLRMAKGYKDNRPVQRYHYRGKQSQYYGRLSRFGTAKYGRLQFMEFPEAIGRPVEIYSVQRRNSSAPLVPPKPKEFDMAYSRLAFRA
jgi:hypothetical protein